MRRKPAARPPLSVTSEALLVEGTDTRFRELLDNLLNMASQVQRLRSLLADELGVSEPQYRLIWAVADLQGEHGVSVSAVARQLRVTGAFITTEVAKLCRKGLVVKQDDPSDGRAVLLRLAPPGEEALARLAGKAQRINDEYFREVSASELVELSSIVAKLVANGERTLHVARALPPAGDRRTGGSAIRGR